MVMFGALVNAQLAWDISDTFNGLMMIPNLIGVIVLSPKVMECTANYVARKMKGNKNIVPMLSLFEDIEEEQLERPDED